MLEDGGAEHALIFVALVVGLASLLLNVVTISMIRCGQLKEVKSVELAGMSHTGAAAP